METTQVEKITYPSADGKTTISAQLWANVSGEPRGVVQLVHGMAEYIGRYDEFARFLNANGFIACGNDHLGHGESVVANSQWGHIPVKGGKDILLSDVHALRTMMQERFGTELPYFIFGHSMGSFITRCYVSRCGQGLAGAIICGTGNVAPALSKAGNKLARSIAKVKGETYRSKMVDGMGAGGYGKMIEGAQTNLDWLSFNRDNVNAYIADERCGFMFSVGGYAAVTSLTAECVDAKSVASIPKTLPLLYIAGAGDPVGDFGKGVREACDLACRSGVKDVTLKIYDQMRHEILNEDGKLTVMADIRDWLAARI